MRAPDRSVTVSWKVSVGITAYRSAVAPVQPKIRSAISVLPIQASRVQACRVQARRPVQASRPPVQGERAVPQATQEVGQRGADLGAAVEPLPVHPELADQSVAHVDLDHEYLVPAFGAVDQDGLDVGGDVAEQRVLRGDPVPGLEVEL